MGIANEARALRFENFFAMFSKTIKVGTGGGEDVIKPFTFTTADNRFDSGKLFFSLILSTLLIYSFEFVCFQYLKSCKVVKNVLSVSTPY